MADAPFTRELIRDTASKVFSGVDAGTRLVEAVAVLQPHLRAQGFQLEVKAGSPVSVVGFYVGRHSIVELAPMAGTTAELKIGARMGFKPDEKVLGQGWCSFELVAWRKGEQAPFVPFVKFSILDVHFPVPAHTEQHVRDSLENIFFFGSSKARRAKFEASAVAFVALLVDAIAP